MSRHLLAAVVVALSCGCAQHTFDWDRELRHGSPRSVPAGTIRIVMADSLYRRVFGQELRDAIVGMVMTDETISCCAPLDARFLSNGAYLHRVHRVGLRRGSYRITHDEVCTRLDGQVESYCFALFRDAAGKFLTVDFRNHSGPSTIKLSPVSGATW
jgi:hypothetical protein